MRIVSLHRYPIKSCQGIDVIGGDVMRGGFSLDRRFMVVDAAGRFRTQRKDPLLALAATSIEGGTLTVSSAGLAPLVLELATADEAGPRVVSRVWRRSRHVVDQGGAAAAWFSELLGSESRLVYKPYDEPARPAAGARGTQFDVIAFADAYPYLLTTSVSLAALQEHMDEPVPMGRFRPNLVVEGGEAWAEDRWREVRIGDVPFAVVADCTRCAITTIDQRSGERFSEPLRALGRHRRRAKGVAFGRYLVPREVGATVRVGDALEVLEVG